MTPTNPHEECPIAAPGAESLPPLPPRWQGSTTTTSGIPIRLFTADQMHAYHRLAHADAQATIDRFKAERDAAFAMSRCECSPDEGCANLARLHAELATLKARKVDVEAVMRLAKAYALAQSNGTRIELDAAREALRAYLVD